jgi:hypothetical protein
MPSAASWERNSSSDSWHVAEIEYAGVYLEEFCSASHRSQAF